MYKKLLASAAALAFLSAGSAHAEEFTGPRIEAQVGWDSASPSSKGPSIDGITYGIVAGYDHAVSENLIVGAEVGVDLFDNKSRSISGTTSYDSSAKREIEASARIGTKLLNNVLVYAKAGYANARFTEAVTVGGTTGNTRTEFSTNLDGVRVGAGVETSLFSGILAKTEYRYTNYQQDVSRHQVMVGLGYRF